MRFRFMFICLYATVIQRIIFYNRQKDRHAERLRMQDYHNYIIIVHVVLRYAIKHGLFYFYITWNHTFLPPKQLCF